MIRKKIVHICIDKVSFESEKWRVTSGWAQSRSSERKGTRVWWWYRRDRDTGVRERAFARRSCATISASGIAIRKNWDIFNISQGYKMDKNAQFGSKT